MTSLLLSLRKNRTQLTQKFRGENVSIIFDGTSRIGEALAVIIWFVINWKVKQRLIRVQMLTKTMTGEEITCELVNILSVKYSISTEWLLACMHDGASAME